ncbi:DUF2017 family protein [Actinophytocola sp. NPDC049390]|uniref:DUF2017 family protein n=1 Tax=Actinophytocola sp. NPDC049390 TaxID=3363894 RepID=UPI0037A26F37
MTDDEVQYGITDDFDAVAVSDGIAVRMTDNVAETLTEMMRQLLRLLEDDRVEPRGRFRRGRSPEAVLRDMFPDAYRDRREAQSFRQRHARVLRDTAAVRRVRDRVVAGTTHVIDQAEIDDWIIALGLSRFLFERRNARKTNELGCWISHVQAMLAATINPRLTGLHRD